MFNAWFGGIWVDETNIYWSGAKLITLGGLLLLVALGLVTPPSIALRCSSAHQKLGSSHLASCLATIMKDQGPRSKTSVNRLFQQCWCMHTCNPNTHCKASKHDEDLYCCSGFNLADCTSPCSSKQWVSSSRAPSLDDLLILYPVTVS